MEKVIVKAVKAIVKVKAVKAIVKATKSQSRGSRS